MHFKAFYKSKKKIKKVLFEKSSKKVYNNFKKNSKFINTMPLNLQNNLYIAKTKHFYRIFD